MHIAVDFIDTNRNKWHPDPLWIILTIIIVIFIIAIAINVWGAEVPQDLWKGIIGEACGEKEIGMYAVACVYRNRLQKGMPLGCVALKRKDLNEFVRKQGRKIEYLAKDIIKQIFEGNAPDITGGATHYENVERFGIPKWAKDMVRTLKIGRHTFYLTRYHKLAGGKR